MSKVLQTTQYQPFDKTPASVSLVGCSYNYTQTLKNMSKGRYFLYFLYVWLFIHLFLLSMDTGLKFLHQTLKDLIFEDPLMDFDLA